MKKEGGGDTYPEDVQYDHPLLGQHADADVVVPWAVMLQGA